MCRFFLCLLIWFILSCQAIAAEVPRTISLNDAILLAVRENPNVQKSQISHIQSKYSLELAEWEFKPHYSLGASRMTSQNYSITEEGYLTKNTSAVNAGVSTKTPYGTGVDLALSNDIGKNYHPGLSLTVTQPLLRGFGRPIVEAGLNDAIDNEKVSRLRVADTLRTTISGVINAYFDVVSNQKTLEMDENALKSAQRLFEQTKLFIKAGHKAGVELVTVETSVASSQTKIESDKNQLAQARSRLLQIIGLDPNSQVTFGNLVIPALIQKYHTPNLPDTKQMVITNDVDYQAAQIFLSGMHQRALAIAEDNTRWKLDLTATGNVGHSAGGGPNAGLNSLVNGINQTDSVGLQLTVPIDDKGAKIALENAKIALHEAEMDIKQMKWDKEMAAMNGWNTIFSAERALHLSEHEVELQKKSYTVFEQKYNYGLIDSLELQSARQSWLSSQQNFINSEINYLRAFVALDQLTGHTLQTWNIQVNYE
jgi:outer membrane protein TolC